MTLRRVVVGAFLLAIGFAAGVLVGYRVMAKPFAWLGSVGRHFAANQYALMQYREGTYPAAQEALEAYIRYLDGSVPTNDPCMAGETPWLDARGLRFDKTLTWARLAMLHENNGNTARADEAWHQVDALAAQGTWKDRSRGHFRDIITAMERAYVLPTPGKPGGA